MKKSINFYHVFLVIFACFLPNNLHSEEIIGNNKSFGQFLTILGKLESSNNPQAIGDNKRAIGIYQIHKICWQDTVDKIGGSYSNCFNPKYASNVAYVYLNKYCPQAVKNNNYEIMARTWNGGPTGYREQSTLKYWEKFKRISRQK